MFLRIPSSQRFTARSLPGLGLACLTGLMALNAAGCVGFGTYPRGSGALSPDGVNNAAGEEIMVAAAQWVLRYDYGAAESAPPVVLNLPANISKLRARRVAEDVGPQVAPATREALAEGRPVYHIGRMAIRGSVGEVDVYRPVFDRPANLPPPSTDDPPGEPVYQCITLSVRGGLEPWHIEASRPWSLGAFTPPVISVINP